MKFRHKISKWLNDCGKDCFEFWFWIIRLVILVLIASLVATFITHIPMVISELVSKALEAAQ